jgi:poly(hydroxyalkanoate) depolymerase family esterase
MFAAISRTLLRLRTWLLVRLGLWRGHWRRAQVTVPRARFTAGWLANDTWSYGLYAPAGLRDDEPAPLVVVLHGCRQRALNFAYAAGWTRYADRARVRLLCPDQRRRANLWRCWNWFHPLAQRGQGEALVVLAAIDRAATQVQVKADAIGAVGLSAGGALAALLAFHHADRFRAVAVVAAPPLMGTLNPQGPRDVMRRGLLFDPSLALGMLRGACAPLAVIHGNADEVVHPRCAQQLVEQARESCRRGGFAITAGPAAAAGQKATRIDHRDPAALRVRQIEVDGLGHAWSGGPGGHPFAERDGAPLTALCAQFFRDAGLFGSTAPRSEPRTNGRRMAKNGV